MIALDSSPDPPLEQVHLSYKNLGPSHPPAKRTPENQLYAYAICDVSTNRSLPSELNLLASLSITRSLSVGIILLERTHLRACARLAEAIMVEG